MVLLPDTFFDLHQAEPNMEIFKKKVGLDGYFGLEPWGIDIQRAYELMTTINKEGVATLSMPEGETMQVQISAELVSEALHLPMPSTAYKMPYHLPDQEKKQLFLQIPNKKETFNELICKELDLPLRLYSQHFVMGKPQKYTQPCKRVAGHMYRALTQGKTLPADFSTHIRQDL